MSATKTKPKPKKKTAKAKVKTKAAKPAKAKKLAKPASPEIEEINYAEVELTAAESKFEDLKSQAKEAKEQVERKRKALRETIRDARNGQATLFSGTKPAASSTNGDGKHATAPATAEDESWRPVKLSSLSIAKGLLKKLAEKNIVTVGDYCDFLKPADNGWTKSLQQDVPGIGKAAVDKIEAALDQFWTEHRAKVASQAKTAGDEVEAVAESTELPTDKAKDADESESS